MRITATTDYALRALLEMAGRPAGTFVPAVTIAKAQGLPAKYVVNILHQLCHAGMVQSRRGVEGGFRLARAAEAITVADVIRTVDGPLSSVRGQAPEDLLYAETAETLRAVWLAVRASVRSVLEEVTVADLAAGPLPFDVKRLATAPDAQLRRPFPTGAESATR